MNIFIYPAICVNLSAYTSMKQLIDGFGKSKFYRVEEINTGTTDEGVLILVLDSNKKAIKTLLTYIKKYVLNDYYETLKSVYEMLL